MAPMQGSHLNASILSIQSGDRISMRDRLSGQGLYIRRTLDRESWVAFLYPNFESPIEGEIAPDPVAAVVRLARKLQGLPQ